MTRARWVCFGLAIALMLVAWFQVFSARDGLVVRSLRRESVPLIYLAPKGAQRSVPGVLVAHGFAGSKQLMLSYGHVLAHSGYAVMLMDFDGHGGNSYPFAREDLEQNLQTAWDALKEQPEWDAKNLASVGHSLGTFATLSAGVKNPASFAATVALSPVPVTVSARFPRNLQIQIGEWESAQIQANGKRILRMAGDDNLIPTVDRSGQEQGGSLLRLLGRAEHQLTQMSTAKTAQADLNAALTQGRAREQLEIPRVEHIGILFSDRSHQAVVHWLNRTFGLEGDGTALPDSASSTPGKSSPAPYRDRRLLWFGWHWLSGLVALVAIAPYFNLPSSSRTSIPLWRRLLGFSLAPVAAGLGLQELNEVIEIQTFGGIQVSSAVALWLMIAGGTALVCQTRIAKPQLSSLTGGGIIFGGLWFAFGSLAQVTWLPWLLIPSRLLLWPVFAVACFPWFLAVANAQQGSRWRSRLCWWLTHSIVLVAGLSYVVYSITEIGFLALLLPFFPVLMAMFAVLDGAFRDVWAYAMGSSLFFAWLLAAVFPLA